jgi:hypothetical protein
LNPNPWSNTPFILHLNIFNFFSIVFLILRFLVPFCLFQYVLFPLFCSSWIIIFLKDYVFNTSIGTNHNFKIIFDCLFFVRSLHSTLQPPFVGSRYPFSSLSTHVWDFIFLRMYFANFLFKEIYFSFKEKCHCLVLHPFMPTNANVVVKATISKLNLSLNDDKLDKSFIMVILSLES